MRLIKTVVISTFNQLPKPHKIGVVAIGFFVGLLTVFPAEEVEASKHDQAYVLDPGVRYPLDLSVAESPNVIVDVEDDAWRTVTVKRGDTLAKIFKRVGFTARDTYNVTQSGQLAKTLVSLKPGEELRVKSNEDGSFAGLAYVKSPTETLQIFPDSNGKLTPSIDKKEIETRYNFAQGEITSSFWNAGVEAGLTDNQIMHLAGIFGWDIDFAVGIRAGDYFNVVFEEQYIEGDFVGYGDIVAAEFVNQNEAFTAIQYSDGNYYTAEGRSMRKSFLRAPVSFKYVSSNFSKARFHPVQKRWKAHRGTDYVAKVGTPVVATGDGKVIRASYDKYNGHHVFIQHGEKYTTKYLHFTKRAVKVGQMVKQGQTVGYLGGTGMVSGPHVHYEFLVDGVHRNPRTVNLPKARPIDKSERQAFEEIAHIRLNQLGTNKRIMLAMK